MNVDKDNTGNDLRSFFKKWPKFYYFIAVVFGPAMFSGLSSKKFLRKYKSELSGNILNLGSGPKRIRPDIKNIDIFPYKEVDIVSDISNLPLKDESAVGIICDNVLEHVKTPDVVVEEMDRVLVAGGLIYISTPFLYPFHDSPSDYQRWTKEGLENLFGEFEIVEVGLRAGPMSALNVWLCYFFATIFSFGNKKLYWLLINLSFFLFFPVKLLDLIFNYWPNSVNMASVLYCVARKR